VCEGQKHPEEGFPGHWDRGEDSTSLEMQVPGSQWNRALVHAAPCKAEIMKHPFAFQRRHQPMVHSKCLNDHHLLKTRGPEAKGRTQCLNAVWHVAQHREFLDLAFISTLQQNEASVIHQSRDLLTLVNGIIGPYVHSYTLQIASALVGHCQGVLGIHCCPDMRPAFPDSFVCPNVGKGPITSI
jgi:hypothetical protein